MAENDEKVVAEGSEAATEVSPEEPLKKHALQNNWTMWYDSPNPNKKPDPNNWHSNIKKIVSFSTVEDFWSLFNNLMQPAKLSVQSNYHLFKDGVMPAWEDPQNEKGGKWVIELKPGERELLNTIWLYTVLAMIGESFEDADELCGAVISLRKSRNRLSIWTKTASNEEAQRRIGQHFKKIIECPRAKITYSAHAQALTRTTPFNKPLYEL